MDAKQNLYEIQMEFVEAFKAQDPETGYFDVVFEIDAKKLYAHRYRLSIISPTFKSMLSERWSSNKNDAIKIKDYKFEEFKEFLIFIYSGSCNITDQNIFIMVDMAEFYGVQVFKEECDGYLSKMDINAENVFHLLEVADKYSLAQLQKPLKKFVSNNFENMAQTEAFKGSEKSEMKSFVTIIKDAVIPEKLFKEVFKWAENRATEKQKVDENIILNDAIKEELIDILPLFCFESMKFEFLLKFVVKKSFLFSYEEMSDILVRAWNRVYVKVIDPSGKVMKGFLNCPEIKKVADVIHSQKNVYSQGVYWFTNQTKPSEPSKLIKKNDIEWYLIYDEGDLALKPRKYLNNKDYLLAEMVAENGFIVGPGCKIEVRCCT